MKTLEEVADQTGEEQILNAVVGFINMEAEDEANAAKIETKMIKNLKWAANKNDSKTIVLHSFAHLSESKAEPAKVAELLDNAEERLKSSGYEVLQTPFGYFLDLDIKAPGSPLTRLFKSF
jgi:hypothetical protein